MKAIYVRVSTEEQAIKGSSIDSQIEACVKKAGTTNVLKYADEGFSGELLERPALNRLREDAR
ncbi:recombinase family protein, partial [Psychrobacter sp. SIMBA_152]